mmetsp:Transcript_103832/g.303083  ORF Transcript_103832/g.303083 Transcript_103832/m.303083 type:complete len:363 (+) Transcript_103832:174-1262(+)
MSEISVGDAVWSRHASPPQPAHVIFSLDFALLHMKGWSIFLQGEPLGRHMLPPQPAQDMPNSASELSQSSADEISSHTDALVRQLCPPHPTDSMPSHSWECAQALRSVMSRAAAPRGRQWLPPQPAQLRFKRTNDLQQTSGCTMSAQLAPRSRHCCPLQPRQRMPSRDSDSSQSARECISEHDFTVPRSRQRSPDHSHPIPNMDLATAHDSAAVCSAHDLGRGAAARYAGSCTLAPADPLRLAASPSDWIPAVGAPRTPSGRASAALNSSRRVPAEVSWAPPSSASKSSPTYSSPGMRRWLRIFKLTLATGGTGRSSFVMLLSTGGLRARSSAVASTPMPSSLPNVSSRSSSQPRSAVRPNL